MKLIIIMVCCIYFAVIIYCLKCYITAKEKIEETKAIIKMDIANIIVAGFEMYYKDDLALMIQLIAILIGIIVTFIWCFEIWIEYKIRIMAMAMHLYL